MAGLLQRSRRLGVALILAISLALVAAVATPLLGDDLAGFFPGPADAKAHHGGPHDGCC